MAGFGATTDPWSFVETGINLVSTSPSPRTGSAAQAGDSRGDVLDETIYDTGTTDEATYEVCPGKTVEFYDTSDTAHEYDFRLGKVIDSKVITSIAVNRSSTEIMQVVIGGENCPSADSAVAKFIPVFPTGFLAGGKNAVAAGISVTAGRVITSSVTNSAQVSKGLDSGGAQACKDIYAGRAESTNELVSSDTAPAATADTANGWALTPGQTSGESNTGYPTASIGSFQNLTRDT